MKILKNLPPAVPKDVLFGISTKISQSRILNFSSNRHILYSTVCHLNFYNKKWGHRARLGEQLMFYRNLSSSEGARANHAKNDAQKGCAMQLNRITSKRQSSDF